MRKRDTKGRYESVGGLPGGPDVDPDIDDDEVTMLRPADGGPAVIIPRAMREISPRARQGVQLAQLAVRQHAQVLEVLESAVAAMRDEGLSWGSVGWVIGTSGQAAQKRFGPEKEPTE